MSSKEIKVKIAKNCAAGVYMKASRPICKAHHNMAQLHNTISVFV